MNHPSHGMLDLNKQYECLIYLRNHEVTTRWAVNTFFVLINTGGMLFFIDKFLEEQPRVSWILVVVPFGGIISCLLWLRMTVHIRKWLDYWNECLGNIEYRSLENNVVNIFHKGSLKNAQSDHFIDGLKNRIHRYFPDFYSWLAKEKRETTRPYIYTRLFFRFGECFIRFILNIMAIIFNQGTRGVMNMFIWFLIFGWCIFVSLILVHSHGVDLNSITADHLLTI